MNNEAITKPAYSLTSEDMERLIPFDCPIHSYVDLKKFNSIDEMIYPNNCCIIFFETDRFENVVQGHWTCITVSPKSESIKKTTTGEDSPYSIVYFNSYGTIPDDEKQKIDKKHQELIGQLDNTLTRLLYLSNNNIEYNEQKLQKFRNGNNTCGRHCVCRIISKDYSLEEYQNFMNRRGTTPDDKVVILTNPVLLNKMSPKKLQLKLSELIIEN